MAESLRKGYARRSHSVRVALARQCLARAGRTNGLRTSSPAARSGLTAHALDRPVELEARPDRARPGAHRLLDACVVVADECCAAEPAEHNRFVVDDEAGVP